MVVPRPAGADRASSGGIAPTPEGEGTAAPTGGPVAEAARVYRRARMTWPLRPRVHPARGGSLWQSGGGSLQQSGGSLRLAGLQAGPS